MHALGCPYVVTADVRNIKTAQCKITANVWIVSVQQVDIYLDYVCHLYHFSHNKREIWVFIVSKVIDMYTHCDREFVILSAIFPNKKQWQLHK